MPARCGSTAAVMLYFRISTVRACVDMRSRTNDLAVLPPAAERACGSRTVDRRIGVLAESAIDALSYAALFPDVEDQTLYASLGGKPNVQQPALVQALIARLPERSEIVAAFDADEAGRRLVDMLRLAVAGVAAARGTDLIFGAHLPAQEGEDWNQILQMDYAAKHSNPAPIRSEIGLPPPQRAR